jgi:hypothetical protein
MASRRSQIGHVGVEIELAQGTAMLGVKDMHIAGTTLTQAANLVQDTLAPTAAWRCPTALRTGTRTKVPRAFFNHRLGKVLNTRNSFCRIRSILAWSHALSSMTSVSPGKSEQNSRKQSIEMLLRCYSLGIDRILAMAVGAETGRDRI